VLLQWPTKAHVQWREKTVHAGRKCRRTDLVKSPAGLWPHHAHSPNPTIIRHRYPATRKTVESLHHRGQSDRPSQFESRGKEAKSPIRRHSIFLCYQEGNSLNTSDNSKAVLFTSLSRLSNCEERPDDTASSRKPAVILVTVESGSFIHSVTSHPRTSRAPPSS
jgi:hypothetical protein